MTRPKKSRTCFGKSSGKPLSEYRTMEDARDSARHVQRKHGKSLTPYRCDTCGKFHLGKPQRRRHPDPTPCPVCTSSDEGPKNSYASSDQAQQVAGLQDVSLRVYACPDGHGYHLTRAPA